MAITLLDQPHRIVKFTSSSFIDPGDLTRLSDGKIAVAWENGPGNTDLERLELSVLSANNTSHTTPAIIFTETPGATAKIDIHLTAGSDGRFMTSWGVDDLTVSQALLSGQTSARLYTNTGTASGAVASHSTSTGGGEFRASFLSLGNGTYLATWTDSQATTLANYDTNVMGRLYSATGAPLGAEFVLTTGAGTQLSHSSTAMGDGRGVVVFESGTTSHANPSNPVYTATGLGGHFITSAGAAFPGSFAIDAITAGWSYEGSAQVVTLGNGGFVVAWQQTNAAGTVDEIHFQRFSSIGLKVGGEVMATRISYLGSFAEEAENFELVELANGGFGLFYNHVFGGGTTVEPHVKLFTMNGVAIGGDTFLTDLAPTSATAYLTYAYDTVLGSSGELIVSGLYRFLPQGLDNGGIYFGTQRFDLGDERLIGTNGVDTLWGREGVNDIILGLGGDDTLNGLSGNDTLDPGASGTDVLRGGLGNDTYVLGTRTTGISITDTGGTDTVTTQVTRSIAPFTTIENLTLIGAANATLTGNNLANVITGGAGNNTLIGGGGVDTMRGGLGNDIYVLGADADIVQDTGGTDTISSTVTRFLNSFAGIENLTLAGTANVNATGSAGVNRLTGNAGNNTLEGSSSADVLMGAAGNDRYIYRNTTSDSGEMVVDSAGIDTIVLETAGTYNFRTFASITGIDAVEFKAAQTAIFKLNAVPSGALQVTGATGAQTLYFAPTVIADTAATSTNLSGFTFTNWGSEDTVKIDGTFGVNTIVGTSRNDFIFGDNGGDLMNGGLGADTFAYGNVDHSLNAAFDTIIGFSTVLGDRIDLQPLLGGTIVLTGNNGADAFLGSGNEVRWQQVGANVEVQISEDGSHVMTIRLAGLSTLDAGLAILL